MEIKLKDILILFGFQFAAPSPGLPSLSRVIPSGLLLIYKDNMFDLHKIC